MKLNVHQRGEMATKMTRRGIVLILSSALLLLILVYLGYNILMAYYGPPNIVIDILFDKRTYKPEDIIRINVKVSSAIIDPIIKLPLENRSVAIEVRSKVGPLYIDQGETNAAGEFGFVFKLPGWAPKGEYTVYVVSPGSSKSANFTVES